MKLVQLVEESTPTFDLHNAKSVDRLAKAIAAKGFPEHFHINLNLINRTNVPVTLELSDKKVNDHLKYHVVTFLYEMDKATDKRLNDMLQKVEDENAGEDSEEYDNLQEELNKRELEVHAELGSEGYTKIHGRAL